MNLTEMPATAMTMVTVTGSLAVPLIGSGILGTGTVAVLSLAAEISLGTTGPEQAGTVAAVVETSGEFGGALQCSCGPRPSGFGRWVAGSRSRSRPTFRLSNRRPDRRTPRWGPVVAIPT